MVVMVGAVVSVNVVKVVTLAAAWFPVRSLTAPVWMARVYLMPEVKLVLGVMVNVFPLTVTGTFAPVLVNSSIHMVPVLIASL